ncbi:MAG: hypothetical protein J2P21_13415 [Chloracidobacterium sp.]|nr:hypothetical protein [Chloracidobacterium sp.]
MGVIFTGIRRLKTSLRLWVRYSAAERFKSSQQIRAPLLDVPPINYSPPSS